jgi:xanthine dehydrogenase accessory factor
VRDVAVELRRLCDSGGRFALATVAGVRGSSPRPVGATMAVTVDGEAVGSISGGCVEGAVYTAAQEVLGGGEPVLETYGISDDDAFAVGLTCGGVLEVLVAEADPGLLAGVLDRVAADESSTTRAACSPPVRPASATTVRAASAASTTSRCSSRPSPHRPGCSSSARRTSRRPSRASGCSSATE